MDIIESKYPVLVLSYNNCEIHCCHLDGYKRNKEVLFRRLNEIEMFFKKNMRYRLWYNVDENELDDEIITAVVQCLSRLKDCIIKIAFIGAGRKKRKFEKYFAECSLDIPREYFSDAERAKAWLV